jgi:MtrB/PioB family decaheme-associated outer membrane protein
MNRHGKNMLLAIALFPLLSGVASAQPAEAQPTTPPAAAEPARPAAAAPTLTATDEEAAGRRFDMSFDAIVGARGRDVSGSIDKFQEYGTVREGFLLESLRARYQRPASADFLELGLQHANQDDESYRLSLGRQGRYRLTAAYDAIPHRFGGGVLLFSGVGTDRLRIADIAQSQLETAESLSAARSTLPFSPSPLADAPQQAIVSGLYDAANPAGFRLDRRRAGVGLEVDLPRGATAWARVQNEERDGARVINAGTYERIALTTAGVHTGDRFLTAGNDLAEPIDHRTTSVAAGVGIHKESWLADVEYTLTNFRNSDSNLRWDNPFRISDAPATGGTPPGGGGSNRGRSAVGYLGLPPDSLSHTIAASGGVDLPMHGRLAAGLSYGIVTQDQSFGPYTLNTAIPTFNAAGVATGFAATTPLPQPNLNGDVRTTSGTLAASVRPIVPVTVSAKYRVYRYDGRSDEITFPGYVAYGDSFWRLEKNDVTGGLDAPVANEVFDYWRHEADLGVDYRVSRMLSVGVEGGWEAWRFDHSRVDKLDEYSAGAGFTVRPFRNASLKARYRYSDRTNEGYLRGATAENPEARGLVNFNWADRRRHLADARVQYAPHRMISVGVIGRFVDEEYGGDTEGGTIADSFRFGRTDVQAVGGSLDIAVTPAERLAVFASYSREYRKEQMANAAKDDTPKSTLIDPVTGAAIPDNFSPVNYWNSDIKNTVDTVGVGASVQLVPERLVLDTRYSLSFSDMDVNTFNPNPIVAAGTTQTLDNAIANDWPTIKSRLHEVVADLGYRFTRNIRAGVRYLYASYDLDDFAWEQMSPTMSSVSVENTTRYLFADTNFNEYQAHVGTVYVAGTF